MSEEYSLPPSRYYFITPPSLGGVLVYMPPSWSVSLHSAERPWVFRLNSYPASDHTWAEGDDGTGIDHGWELWRRGEPSRHRGLGVMPLRARSCEAVGSNVQISGAESVRCICWLGFLAIKLRMFSFQLSLHDQPDTETHLSRANYREATCDIKVFSVRISHNVQRFGSMCFCR
jgi:hypothetical protein